MTLHQWTVNRYCQNEHSLPDIQSRRKCGQKRQPCEKKKKRKLIILITPSIYEADGRCSCSGFSDTFLKQRDPKSPSAVSAWLLWHTGSVTLNGTDHRPCTHRVPWLVRISFEIPTRTWPEALPSQHRFAEMVCKGTASGYYISLSTRTNTKWRSLCGSVKSPNEVDTNTFNRISISGNGHKGALGVAEWRIRM